MFYTLQGEGAQAGRAAVFCRFAGCNLWSGREQDRASAVCKFCDTDFVGTDGIGGGKFNSPLELAKAIARVWKTAQGQSMPSSRIKPYVVFTGGEPMLQLTPDLVDAVHNEGFEVAIETNGTLPVPESIDWICVSPKQGSELVQTKGHELKVVVPQLGQNLDKLAALDFQHLFIQPRDDSDPAKKQHYQETAVKACMNNPQWRLSLQTHKVIGIA